MRFRHHIFFGCLLVTAWLLAGCFIVTPSHYSEDSHVYARTNENRVMSEVLIEVRSVSGHVRPLTPEGPVNEGSSKYARRYYFSDRHVRRREIPFLRRDDVDFLDTWETFAPVDGTDYWVRVEGPSSHRSKNTNTVVMTVFTRKELLYQQKIQTRGLPSLTSVHFADGNRDVVYKSTDDGFVYDILKNGLERDITK